MPMDPLAALLSERPPQQLSATELRARIALLEDAAKAYRAELESRVRLDALPDEIQQVIFGQLCNPLDPLSAVAYSSASKGLWEPMQRVGEGATKSPLQQLKEENAAAAALALKARKAVQGNVPLKEVQSCKELSEAKEIWWSDKGLSTTDLGTLGKLIPVLPALETLGLEEGSASAGPDGGQLVKGLGVGALPAMTGFVLLNVCLGDEGASALAAALDRGALPRLKILYLHTAAIGDAGLVALAPALRRRPALERLELTYNPFGDEGLAALVAPPPADAPPPQAEALAKLSMLDLSGTKITDAGCALLASSVRRGGLPALEDLPLEEILASDAAIDALYASYPGQQEWEEESDDTHEYGLEEESDEDLFLEALGDLFPGRHPCQRRGGRGRVRGAPRPVRVGVGVGRGGRGWRVGRGVRRMCEQRRWVRAAEDGRRMAIARASMPRAAYSRLDAPRPRLRPCLQGGTGGRVEVRAGFVGSLCFVNQGRLAFFSCRTVTQGFSSADIPPRALSWRLSRLRVSPLPRSLSRARQHFIVCRSRFHSSQPCYRLATLLWPSQHCYRSSLPPLPRLSRSPVCGRSSWAAAPQACCSRTACLTPAARSRYSRVGLTREHLDTSRAEPTRSASGYAAALQSALSTRTSGRRSPPRASRQTGSRSISARGSRSICARPTTRTPSRRSSSTRVTSVPLFSTRCSDATA